MWNLVSNEEASQVNGRKIHVNRGFKDTDSHVEKDKIRSLLQMVHWDMFQKDRRFKYEESSPQLLEEFLCNLRNEKTFFWSLKTEAVREKINKSDYMKKSLHGKSTISTISSQEKVL